LDTVAFADTFLSRLPPEARDALLADATLLDVSRRQVIFGSNDRPRAGFMLSGLARTFLTARDGRQLSLRYLREGDAFGSVAGRWSERAQVSVAAVTDCLVAEVEVGTLLELVQTDARVGAALVVEITLRLQDGLAALAANALGSMHERVAWHLMDLAVETSADGRYIACVTQQHLADNVGTAREVVARVLRELREAGIVSTTKGQLEITDPVRLAAIAGRKDVRSV
jgi:CRP/FNR family transcriptional regulator